MMIHITSRRDGSVDPIPIGPFYIGEKPGLTFHFMDERELPVVIPISYNAKIVIQEPDSSTAEDTASITDHAAGEVVYEWVMYDVYNPGSYLAQIWVGNSGNKFASQVVSFEVLRGVGLTPDFP